MDFILNGEERDLDLSDCANLAELVAIAETFDAGREESVVVAVEIDGEELSPDELSALETRSLDGIDRVAIQRKPTRVVAYSVLEQGADYCGQIVDAMSQTVEHFQSGRADKGNELLADVTDSLTVLTGITYSVASILKEDAESLAAVQGEIFPWLQELVEAQGEEDPLRIADLLEYEIKTRIEQWGTVMRALSKGEPMTPTAGTSPLSN